MYPVEVIPDYWRVILMVKVVYAVMTYILLKWVNRSWSAQESEWERRMKKMRKELTFTKEENDLLTRQLDGFKKCVQEYQEKNSYLTQKLDFQETLFEREYEKRVEQEEKSALAANELNRVKLELSKIPMVKQIFKSKIRGLEKQLVWVMSRFKKKEGKCLTLQKSEASLKDQTETLEKENKGYILLVEKYKKRISERHDKDEELLRELRALHTCLEKSPSVYKKKTKKKMVERLIFILENSLNDFGVS